jgi:hypothetical protein
MDRGDELIPSEGFKLGDWNAQQLLATGFFQYGSQSKQL